MLLPNENLKNIPPLPNCSTLLHREKPLGGFFTMEKLIGIYKITSPSGKVYIGQSVFLQKRLRAYKKLDYCKNQTKVYNSFKKYGIESHRIEIIEYCNEQHLNEREIFYINQFNCLSPHFGLNVREGGSKGRHSEESKKKMSINNSQLGKSSWNKGIPVSEEHKAYLRSINLGKKHSEEAKLKMSIARAGKSFSKEHCVKIGRSGENHHAYGKKFSYEYRKKISVGHIKLHQNKECGVSYDKSRGKWMAYITRNGVFKNLGRFDTKEIALLVRKNYEKMLIAPKQLTIFNI